MLARGTCSFFMKDVSTSGASKAPKRWIYPVSVIVVTLLGFPIAAGFYTPAGPRARVLLPGVMIAMLMAVIVSVLFLRCPRRPLWLKVLTLALALPALFFAVTCVMDHIALSH
jgi:hypothetical protein